MGASGTPIFKTVAADDVGVTLDFGQQVKSFALRNDGPSVVYFTEGAIAPSASRGNGRFGLNVDESISLPKLGIQKLSFICATGQTASVQAIGAPDGAIALSPVPVSAGAYNLIDLSSMGIVATPTVAGPVVMSIPMSSYSDYDLSFLLKNVQTDHMSVGQGDVSDVGFLQVLIEAELDSSGVFREIMRFQLSIGGGGSGAGGVGASFKNKKTKNLSDLKALGTTITKMRATCTVTQSAGSGVMSGAVDFTNFALVIFSGTQGPNYG
jgi:hypothetical protein